MSVRDYSYGVFVIEDYLVRGKPTTLEVMTAESIRRGTSGGMEILPSQVKITMKYNSDRTMNASGLFHENNFTLQQLCLTNQLGIDNLTQYQEDLTEIFANPLITKEIRDRQH